jgi:hypothetical protein
MLSIKEGDETWLYYLAKNRSMIEVNYLLWYEIETEKIHEFQLFFGGRGI